MPNQEDLKQHLVSLLLPFAKRNVPNEEKLRNELVVVLDHLLEEEKYSDWLSLIHISEPTRPY